MAVHQSLKPAKGLVSATWALTNADGTGDAFNAGQYADKVAHVYCAGTIPTWAIEGSLDGSNYTILVDTLGNLINYAVQPKLLQILQNVLYVRPRILSGADGTTALTAIILARSGAL